MDGKKDCAVTTGNILKALYESVMQERENNNVNNSNNSNKSNKGDASKISEWLRNDDPLQNVPQINLANYSNAIFEPITEIPAFTFPFTSHPQIQQQQIQPSTTLIFHVHVSETDFGSDGFLLKTQQVSTKEFFFNDLVMHKSENLYNALMACLGVAKRNDDIKLNKMLCQSIPDKFNYIINRYKDVSCVINFEPKNPTNLFLNGIIKFFERNTLCSNVVFSSNLHMSTHLAMAVLSGVNKYVPLENNYSYYKEFESNVNNELSSLTKRFGQKNVLLVTNDEGVYNECEEVNIACYRAEKIQDFVYLSEALEVGLV